MIHVVLRQVCAFDLIDPKLDPRSHLNQDDDVTSRYRPHQMTLIMNNRPFHFANPILLIGLFARVVTHFGALGVNRR